LPESDVSEEQGGVVIAEGPKGIAPGIAVRVGGVAGVATSFPEDGKVMVEREDGKVLPYDESEVEVVDNSQLDGDSSQSTPQNDSGEPEPVGVGTFGEIYDQFKGKVKEAVAFLLRRKNGEAVGALHHGEVGDISVVYGNDGYGLAHIAKKHPEVLSDLQGTIDGMVVTSQSDNRIVLESSTHRAVISKMLGNEPTSNWLLTAYEKKNPASASSSDIETEPEGKQNGTATLQNEISEGEDSENKSDMQEGGVNTPAIPVDAKGEPMYESAPVEATIADIYNDPDLDEDEADAFVQAKIDGATKRIAQLEKKKPKMGEDEDAYIAERAKWREQLEAEQVSLAYWQGVQEAVPEMRRKERAKRQMEADIAQREREQQERAEQSRRAEERGRNRGDYRKAMAQWEDTPSSFHEYVAQALLVGNHKMRWNDNGSTRGLGSHTTGRRGVNRRGEVVTARNDESRAMGWLIDDRGGLSPEALADKLWNEYTGSYGEDMSEGSPLDVLLDVVTSMPTPQMMWDYVKGEHDARMEAEQGGYEEQYSAEEIEAFERDAMYREKYGVSEEEYWANEAQWDEFIESREMSAEELDNYDNFVAEERIKEEHERRNKENAEDDQRSDNSESEGGVEVLPGTQPDITRGNEDVAGESEGVDGNGVESNDVAQEETAELSEEDRQAIDNMPIPMLKRQIKDTATTLFNVSQNSDQWQEENKDKIERAKLLLAYAKQELARKERLKKSNKWGVKVGNTATPFDMVRKMFEEFNSNEDLAQLFEKVAKVFETLPIKVVFSDTIGAKSTQGWFSPTTGTLKLPGYFVYGGGISEQNKAETILHEMIHAVTTYALYINEKPYLQTELGFRLSDDMHAAIRQLKRIYASIASDKDFKGEYGAVSVHEMIAELSNVQFREKLKKKGLWETIVDAIKQLFGITPSNALEGAEAALEYMLNNFDRSQWEKMAGMGEKRGKQMRIGVDKQIIGEKGASALDKADEVTHRMDNLGVAREMEADGKDAKAIRMATGWERGADGKWRYEIEDYSIKEEKIDFITNQLDYKNTATIILKDLLEDAQGLFAAYPELRNMRVVIKKDSSVIGQGELQWYDAVYDRQIVLNEAAIISHFAKSALERYGKADVGIIRIKQGYDPTTKEKFTNEADKQEALKTYIEMMNEALLDYHRFKGQNKDIATSILTHEIQHAIQFIEGFARGSSPKEFADVRGAVLDSIDFMTNGDLLKGNSISNSQSLRDALNKKIPYTNISLKEGYIDNLQKVARKYGYDNIDALVDDFEKMPSAFEQYHRTAGEVEARNASARMGMSADERRATLLSETEDVAREDQIFLMENSGVSAMAEGEINDLISQMKANASVEPIVEISEENWVDKIGTPIGEVKMGEHQKSKLFNKGREKQYGMLLETLSNPDIVLEEQSKEDPTHERDSVYLFIKTFQKEDGSKYVHFESVTVKQDGLEVSISSHIIRENQLRNKMKRDRLLYKATALDQSTNSSAEQSIKGGSLSSIDKGSDNIGDVQGLENYSAEELKEIAREYIEDVIAESGFDAEVVDLAIYGSRRRGDGRDDSDLDIVVEYSGNAREDDLFNALNDAETQLEIDGVKVDINPITKSKSGTLGEFMERVREYDEGNESTKESQPLSRGATAPLSEQEGSLEDDGLLFRDGDVTTSPLASGGELGTTAEASTVGYSDAEVSMANDPIAKIMGKSQRSGKQQAKFAERERKAMRNRVAELAEKMHLDNVEVVESSQSTPSPLTPQSQATAPLKQGSTAGAISSRKARAKGWFDTKTGKIVINISNHTSVADVERTLLHEAVAHYGLRELFGKQFDTFLDNVYLHADAEVRAQIIELAKRRGWDFRTATEEYLAGLAEETNFEALEHNWSWWQKIKQLFMDMLESIGWDYKGPELSDNELRYLLWRSYENMVNPGRHRSILGMAEDVAKQYALGVGNYSADAESMSQVAEEGEKAEPQPIGNGAFGAIYTQFRGKAKEAIAFLMRKQSGEAIGALSHPEIGEIDLVWGKEGTSHSDGYGLAKLVKYHPEVLDNLQEILSGMNVVKRSPNRVQLESNTHKASVRLTWDNQRKTWLLTAFEKKETPETTISSTGVDNSPKGLLDDTAPQQSSSVSADKGTINLRNTNELGEKIAEAESEVNTNPTDKQKEAGNYKKGHVQIGTFNVTIEQPKGSVRSGVDADGNKWETEMQNTYGYIRGTEGVDGDHIDVFLSDDIDGWDGHKVFVVDQRNADGSFDEHKVMLGFNDINDAEVAYMSNYEEGWQGLGAITGVSIEEFEKWIASSHRKTKAFAEYKSVKTTEGQSTDEGILFRDGESDGTREEYDRRVRTTTKKLPGLAMTGYNFMEAFFNELRSVEILQDIIKKKYGLKKLPSYENVLDAENRLSSMNLQEFKTFVDGIYEKLMSYSDKWIRKGGETQDSINRYMIAKSGLERNREFTVRDAINERLYAKDEKDRISKSKAKKWRQEYVDARNALLKQFKDGDIDYKEFNRLADSLARRYAGGRAIADYSGLSGVTEDAENFREKAEQIVLEFESRHGDDIKGFWESVNECTRASLKKSYASGLLTKELYEHLNGMFEWYVPMRGFDDNTAEDVYSYIGADTGVFNPTVASAKGHTEVSQDALATIANMMQSAILQGNRNSVKQAFFNFYILYNLFRFYLYICANK